MRYLLKINYAWYPTSQHTRYHDYDTKERLEEAYTEFKKYLAGANPVFTVYEIKPGFLVD